MEMQTLGNPLGYTIPRIYMKENADWDKLFSGCEGEERREVIATCKKFIRQVIESRGYDVDCQPPWSFNSPYLPVTNFKNMKLFYPRIKKVGQFVIWKLNNALMPHTRTRYKLVDVEKVVNEDRWNYVLLTLTAKEVDASVCDKVRYKKKFKEGYLDLWGNDKIQRGEEYKQDDDDDDAEVDDSCNDNSEDGDGAIVTVQATVDTYPNPGKGYQVTDLRVRRDGKGYQFVGELIDNLTKQ